MIKNYHSKFINKINNQWHYFPYGTILENISMPIRAGEKQKLQEALNRDWITVMTIPPMFLFMGIGLQRPWLALLGIIVVPYIIHRKRKAVRKHCEYIHYPYSIFIKNYFKIRRFLWGEIDSKVINKFWLYGLFSLGLLFTAYSFYKDFGGFYEVVNSEKQWHFVVNLLAGSLLAMFSSLLTLRFVTKKKYIF